MHIESLRYFVELARAGSFYRAAKNVYISQQGLNKAVSSLESELGVKLVERANRGVRLTSAGEVFLEHACTLLLEYSDTLKDLYAEHATSSHEDRRLVIHMTYYPSQVSEPFVRAMKAFDSINIVEEPFARVVEGARESDGSELFLADVYGASERHDLMGEMMFEQMLITQAGVVWRDGSPFAGRSTVHREQLEDEPLAIDSNREMTRLAEYVMEDHELNNIRLGVANPRGRIEYAASSTEIALLYDSFGFELAQASERLNTDELHFTPFSTPRSYVPVGFLYPKKARPNTRARHVIEALRYHSRTCYADYLARYPLP